MSVFAVLIGICFGITAAWLSLKQIQKVRTTSYEERIQLLQDENNQVQNNLVILKTEVEKYRLTAETVTLEKAKLEEQVKQVPQLQGDLERVRTDLNNRQLDITEIKSSNSRLTTQLEEERKQSAEKLKILLEAKEQLKTEFQNLANQIFDEKGKKFTEQNKANLDVLLSPFKEQLGEFKKKVEEVYLDEAKERSALLREVQILKQLNNDIGEEAKNLTRALKSENKTMGNWGEVVLERVLEESGLRKDMEYLVQPSFKDEAGNMLRPDILVLLPGKKHVIIDSKVSLKDYEQYISAESDVERQVSFDAHISSLRNHIKGLGNKQYENIKELNAPDFVLMFVPVEAAFLAAIEKDKALFSDAFNKNIVIVCPSTLLVTLRTIKNIWNYEYQNRNAKEIAEQAGRLYDKFVGFIGSLDAISGHLKKAVDSTEDAYKQLSSGTGNLISRVQKLKQLGAKTTKQIDSNLVEDAEVE